MEEDKRMKKIGFNVGYMLGVTIYTCLMIATIALTIKLLTWLF